MALTTVTIQDALGATQQVLLDTVTGQTYAIPLYKLSIGVAGSDDGPVSASNPLPVTATALDVRPLTNADVVTAELSATDNAVLDSIDARLAGTLTVAVASLDVSVSILGDTSDLDSGAGADAHEVFAIGLPGDGGHVIGGTAANPLRTDPTGSTTQPVSGTVTADLGTIAGVATETTAAAILAKVIAAPATEAKQDTLIAKDFATQTTLAAILAKLLAAPATEAKQDTLISGLAALIAELQAKADLSETQPVSLASVPSHAVTNAGTFAVQSTEARPATATLANVSTSTTVATLLASNANRRSAVIYNDGTSIMYVKFGSAATSTSFTYRVSPGQHLEFQIPCYTGIVTGILDAGAATARVTEMT